ncbi:hypothetical protein [Streptomyces sp. 2A115]|uniref:hypothetical protein n=1 Tax=Streptomyces sp. 2A115 TaxID=3457439 RepID=UPI003FD1DB7C
MSSDTTGIILVTGASSDFGALIARALARADHTVLAGIRQPATRNTRAVEDLMHYAAGRNANLHAVELDVISPTSRTSPRRRPRTPWPSARPPKCRASSSTPRSTSPAP